MKKKILYINTFEPPYRMKFYNTLGNIYDITMLLSQTQEDRVERNQKWFTETERNYHRIQMKTRKIHGENVAFEVKKILKSMDYDMAFIDAYGDLSNMYTIRCLKKLKIPYILSVDGMLPRERESKLRFLLKKYLLNGSEYILSPGASVDKCLEHYGVHPEMIRRFHFTPYSRADLEQASVSAGEKLQARKALHIPDSEKHVLLYVGQFVHRKGIDVLLKAAAGMDPSVGIYLVGGAPTHEYLQLAEQYHLEHVHFSGFKTKDELRDYYRAADAFVLPTREDIWGLVINEAMAYGLPVITTDRCVAGLELVHPGENGWIVPVGDADGIAAAAAELFSDEEKVLRYGVNSRKIVEDYTSEQMAEDHRACFEELLKNC